MKYLWYYFGFFGLNVLTACVVYIWFPNYRYYLVKEDSLIENLSAAFYLLSCLLAILFLKKRKGHKKLLILISVVGLLGFLDELSFGQRIWGFPDLHIGGMEVDAAHDFFKVLKKPIYLHGIQFCLFAGALLIIAFIGCRSKLINAVRSIVQKLQYIFLLFFVILVFSALLIDLEIVYYKPLIMVEELFEMNSAIALCFCIISLPKTLLQQ